MSEIKLLRTKCAICDTEDNATEIYGPNFELTAFNEKIFSARRMPDKVHYRMVRCNRCGLMRSDPVVNSELLTRLYVDSHFDYQGELEGLRYSYKRQLAALDRLGVQHDSLLEIGCGNGFFLELARQHGYQNVYGVEPSTEAVLKAPTSLRDHIICDMMKEGLFPKETFDVICLFQVFDHLPNPASILQQCYHILKPGGALVLFQHNIDSFSAKILGERSPIIDIEHTYLYSPKTLSLLVAKYGYNIRSCQIVWNRYSLSYLTRLIPIPKKCKFLLLQVLKFTGIGKLMLSVPLGNFCLIAQK